MKIKYWQSGLLICSFLFANQTIARTCGNTIDLALTIGSKGLMLRDPNKPVIDGSIGIIYANELYVLRENGRTVQNGMANGYGQVQYQFVIGQLYELDNLITPQTFIITDSGCPPQLTQAPSSRRGH